MATRYAAKHYAVETCDGTLDHPAIDATRAAIKKAVRHDASTTRRHFENIYR